MNTWSPIAVATWESSGNFVAEDEPLKGLVDDGCSSLEDDPQGLALMPVSREMNSLPHIALPKHS